MAEYLLPAAATSRTFFSGARGVYYQENTSYHLVLEHPSRTQLRLRRFTSQRCSNNTPTPQSCALTPTLTYSESSSFAFAFKQGLKVTMKFQAGLTLPVLKAATDTTIEVALETTETWTDTITETNTYTSTVTATTSGNSIYKAQIFAAQVIGTIPYTASGLATLSPVGKN
jgi:hypothetical protein